MTLTAHRSIKSRQGTMEGGMREWMRVVCGIPGADKTATERKKMQHTRRATYQPKTRNTDTVSKRVV